MKKKDVLTVIISLLVLSFLCSETEALSILPHYASQEAVKLCQKTGGKIMEEEGKGRYPPIILPPPPSSKTFCLCPDGSKQSLMIGEVEEWQGCKIVNMKQIISIVIFEIETFFGNYLRFLFIALCLGEAVWLIQKIRKKKITLRSVLIFLILSFSILLGFVLFYCLHEQETWFLGFQLKEPPNILTKIYIEPFISFLELLENLGLCRDSLVYFLIFLTSFVFWGTILNFFIILTFLIFIKEVPKIIMSVVVGLSRL